MKEIKEGVEVLRVKTYMTANEGFLKRTLDFMSFAVSAVWEGRKHTCDVILSSSPPLFTCFAAYVLSIIKKKPWVLEIRDLWPESIKDVGIIKQGKIYSLLEKIELFFYRKADKIVAVSPGYVKDLVDRGVPASKIACISNGPDIVEATQNNYPDAHIRKITKIRESASILVGYIGRLGMAHELEVLVETAKILEKDSIHFVFVGEGSEEEKLLALSKDYKLNNVHFLDALPKNQLAHIYPNIDIGVVIQREAPSFKKNIPSKLYDLSAAGLPLAVGVDGVTRELVEEFNCGLFFQPGDTQACADVIRKIATQPELRKALTEGGKTLAEQFSRDNMAERMRQFLKNTVNPK